jgi:polyhydroxyalkanoate synthase
MTGQMRLGGRVIRFEDTSANVLSAYAERDNVVPVAAAEPSMRLVGDPSRRDELRLGGGHVTFATGRQAFQHTLPAIAQWIAEHSDELDPPKER